MAHETAPAIPRSLTPGPLRDVRVIDFSWIVAGPQATRILADFGADVIRVEYEGRPDSIRFGMRDPKAPPGSPNASGFFNNLNRNKRSVTLNLQHPDGQDLFRRLLMVSDVVVENFSATVFERLGWTWEAMAAINPGIIYLSLSGFGHLGRDRENVTWGPTAQAVSGLTAMSGLPGHDPAGWGYSYLDHTAGYYGAAAVLLALHHRQQTGEGQYIDLSQIETGMVLAGPAILDYTVNGRRYVVDGGRFGNHSRHPRVAPHNSYRCRGDDPNGRGDGRWVTIACFTEAEWRALVAAMGSPAWAADARFATNAGRVAHEDELDACIAAWTAEREPYDVMYTLQEAGVPAGVVQHAGDKQECDPQLRARGFYPEIEHAELGRHAFEGMPVTATRTPWRLRAPAPLLGEHIPDVYGGLLGLSDAEIAELYAGAAL
jgi:crotonobetainyl-CoA:carnitine CoA-transferase CaiB-like acyl-CoA transferase